MGYYDFKTNSVSGQSALYLGTFTSGTAIDVSSKYSKYGSLTADNFAVVPTGGSATTSHSTNIVIPGTHADPSVKVTGSGTSTYTFNKTYNASTGTLTITNTVSDHTTGTIRDQATSRSYNYDKSSSTNLSAKVYLLPSIQDVS